MERVRNFETECTRPGTRFDLRGRARELVAALVGRLVLLILRLIGYVYAYAPRRAQLAWGAILGKFLFLTGFRSSVIQQNLEIAYPEQKPVRDQRFRNCYTHLGNLILEIILLLGPMKRFILKNSDLLG